MKNLLPLILLLLPLISLGQWQGNMVNNLSGNEISYTVFSDLDQYRYEFAEEGMNGVVIVKPAINQTAILLVDEKKVHYTPCDGMLSKMNDPVQAYFGFLETGNESEEGYESVEGYDCIKKTASADDGTIVFSMWFSEELNFPLKIKAHQSEGPGLMEITNIQNWKVDPSVFEVPDDYVEVDKNMKPLSP